MRLSRIEIVNLKGIGAVLQSIDLKPITLLFGPNSVGKSTILQALHYLREILRWTPFVRQPEPLLKV
jgi:predicted ATPase